VTRLLAAALSRCRNVDRTIVADDGYLGAWMIVVEASDRVLVSPIAAVPDLSVVL